MIRAWQCTLRATQPDVKLLVTSPEHGDLLKVQLSPRPCHPRALLTMLEGLSLWSGHPLFVAPLVDEPCHNGRGWPLLGDELWPGESPLVRFDVARRASRPVRLRGIGDVRDLRREAP